MCVCVSFQRSHATQSEFETTVSNNALLWEGEIATGVGGSQNGEGGRFLVSCLNLLNSFDTSPWLLTEPVDIGTLCPMSILASSCSVPKLLRDDYSTNGASLQGYSMHTP